MATRAALTQAEREFIVQRKQAGDSLASLGAVLGCASVTVRKWWRRQQAGRAAQPRGRPRRGTLKTYPAELVEEAVALKQSHPHWGPANVKLQLKRDERFASAHLPSDARLAALFGERCPQAVQRRLRQAYPDRPVAQARCPHQRWQLDGQERVDLPAIGRVTFLNLRDPVGAVMVGSRAISTGTPHQWRKVSLPEVQAFLRQAFAEWGKPLEIQTDHEPTYTGPAKMDCPSPFTLWLAGLGIAHVTSRDRRPTDQAQAERTHRTLAEMGWLDEPGTSLAALQAVLDDRRQRYNHELPVRASDCHGRPPLVAHPHAIHSGRPFQPALEWELFDLAQVDAYLAGRLWTRQVNAAGNVGFLGQQYTLGRAYTHQAVSLRFIPETRCFHFTLANGTALPDRPARGLNQEDLIGFLPIEFALTTPYQFAFHLQGV
jgi:transposase InsO family protein